MCRWIGVGEAADLLLLIVQQPADPLLWWVPLNLWSVLVRHVAPMAKLQRTVARFRWLLLVDARTKPDPSVAHYIRSVLTRVKSHRYPGNAGPEPSVSSRANATQLIPPPYWPVSLLTLQ